MKRLYLRCALVLLAAASFQLSGEVRPLTILHINDIHAHLAPLDNGQGGFAALATVIRREREGCAACILLNAGDLAQGTPVSTIFHGLPVFELSNLLSIDAATIGNHDFDYGWMQTRKFIATVNYPMVSANMVGKDGQAFAKPYVILHVNGLRVAVIGAMTETLPSLVFPKALGEWHPVSVVETARRYAAELRPQSDLVVLLAHIDAREETAVLEQAPGVAVLVSGHVHTGIAEPRVVDGRIMVRVKSYTQELGRLDLEVDTERKAPVSWKWKIIPIAAGTPQAADVAKKVAYWEDQVKARVDRPLAVARHSFNTKDEIKALEERAIREETGADFAFVNRGSVRDVLPEGQLLERNIWDIMPFDNRVVVGTFKGRDLPPVVLGGKTVESDREYTLAVSDFTAANQNTAENLQTTGLEFPHDVGLLRDILIDWFRKQKVIE
ncbi:MAG: bifunctional metallophosphatase/5'-nucleotidase [Bryobacteraceae bacterium]